MRQGYMVSPVASTPQFATPKYSNSVSIYTLADTRVVDVQHQDIRRPNLGKLVHSRRKLLLLNHGADRNPTFLLQWCHRCRSLAGGDKGRLLEVASGHVVLDEDVSLGGDNTTDSGGDEFEDVRVPWRFRLDQDRGRLHHSVYCLEACCLHGLARLCIS